MGHPAVDGGDRAQKVRYGWSGLRFTDERSKGETSNAAAEEEPKESFCFK